MSRISRMTATMDVKARIRTYHASGLNAPVATGGYMADIAEAYSNRLADGGQAVRVRPTGLLSGPGTGTSDDILARVSTREFITNADATAYYGVPLMYALNQKRIPREWFAALGFAGGGTPSVVERTYSAPRSTPSAAATLTTTARLDPADIDRLAHTIVGVAQGVSSRTVDSAFLALGRGV